MWLSLVLLVTLAGDLVAPGREALESLEYEKALRLLLPVANDEKKPRPLRAKAFVLVAQAHFGIATVEAEDRARAALRSAFRLDRNVELSGREDVSPKLVALYDEFRARLPKPKADDAEEPDPTTTTSTTTTPTTSTTATAPVSTTTTATSPSSTASATPTSSAASTNSTSSTTSTTSTTSTNSTNSATSVTPPDETPGDSEAAPLSPWLVGAVAAGAVAGVGVATAVGCELWLTAVPRGTEADQVRAVQGLGVAGVVGATVAAIGATAAAVVHVVTTESPDHRSTDARTDH